MGQRITILVVDDDATQADFIGIALQEDGGYRILKANNTVDAMNIVKQEHPALVLSDHYMPGEDGFSFCRRIKEDPLLKDTMFILLTAASDVTDKVRGLEIGADDYITKPFYPEELVSRVRAMLRLKALQDELQEDKAELARLNNELGQSLKDVLSLFGELIGQRIPNATARGERAAQFATWMGKRFDFEEEDLRHIEIAARLHEIGKINLQDDIIRKNLQELNEQQRSAYLHFPIFGEVIVSSIPRLRTVATYIRHQLENFDGTGHPDRLMRDHIPMASRILRVSNYLYELSQKPAQQDLSIAEQVLKAKGTLLDPRVAQLAEEYLRVVEDPNWMEGKRQVHLFELEEGMVIANDLCTGSGTKLLSQNTRISAANLERILSHHQFDAIIQYIYIYT